MPLDDLPRHRRLHPWPAGVARCAVLALAVWAGPLAAQSLASKAKESGCVDAPRVVEGATYRCTTASGASAYFNVPDANSIARRPAAATGTPAPPGAAATAPGLPRVDAATQKGRDELRRKVLQEELSAEEKLLADSRVAYANGAPPALPEEQSQPQRYAERIGRLRQAVQLHERNIEALRRELSASR